LLSQVSPEASAMTCALLIIGTARKSKLSSVPRVKPEGRLARRQACFGKVALDAPLGALGDLKFGKCREEPSGRPALLVGASGDILPQAADGRQPQLVQQQRQSGDVGSDLAHAETSAAWLLSNAS
jgi:hypothetical protein